MVDHVSVLAVSLHGAVVLSAALTVAFLPFSGLLLTIDDFAVV